MKSSTSIWHLLHNVKSTVKISSIFVVFSENMNFKVELKIKMSSNESNSDQILITYKPNGYIRLDQARLCLWKLGVDTNAHPPLRLR